MVKRVRPFFQRGRGQGEENSSFPEYPGLKTSSNNGLKKKIPSIEYSQVVERETIKESSELNCRFEIR